MTLKATTAPDGERFDSTGGSRLCCATSNDTNQCIGQGRSTSHDLGTFGKAAASLRFQVYGGEGGIRAPDARRGVADFESAAFNRALHLSAAPTLFLAYWPAESCSNVS